MKILERNKKMLLFMENVFIYSLIIFFEIFSSVPIRFFNNFVILPNIASILIFIFLIIGVEEINYFALFVLGFLFDAFNLLPFGSTSLIWLISSKIVNILRTHLYTPDTLITNLRDFTIYTLISNLFGWILFSVIYRTAYPISVFILQIILNVIFFAVLYRIIKKLERLLT